MPMASQSIMIKKNLEMKEKADMVKVTEDRKGMGLPRKAVFRYYVYADGQCIFESSRKYEAEIWLGEGTELIRRNLLTNERKKLR